MYSFAKRLMISFSGPSFQILFATPLFQMAIQKIYTVRHILNSRVHIWHQSLIKNEPPRETNENNFI